MRIFPKKRSLSIASHDRHNDDNNNYSLRSWMRATAAVNGTEKEEEVEKVFLGEGQTRINIIWEMPRSLV